MLFQNKNKHANKTVCWKVRTTGCRIMIN